MGGSAGSGGGGAAFSTIQPDAGTSPVATGADTLTLTCVDNALTITGDAATDKITFGAGTALALLGGRAAGQTLNGSTASAGALILSSTAHGTKGLIQLGADSAYDEALGELFQRRATPPPKGPGANPEPAPKGASAK